MENLRKKINIPHPNSRGSWVRVALIALSFALCLQLPALAVGGVASDPSHPLYSARQMGMGGLAIGFSDDANGLFSNPAGLTGFEFPQLTASSRKLLLEETQYTLAGWVVPTNYGNFGIGYVGLGTGGSIPTMRDPATGRITINPSQEASSYSSAVTAFSYTKQLPLPIKTAIGGNLKFYNQSISGNSKDNASASTIDLSVLTRPNKWLRVGADLQNILGSTLKWSSTEDKLGGYFKLGGGANILGSSEEALLYNPQHQVDVGLDLDLPGGVLTSSNSLLYHLGVEYRPLKDIALRVGFNQETSGTGLTLGLGLTNSGFRFDYAYAQRPGLPGDNPSYFSLSYIGERVVTVSRKLEQKLSALRFLQPKDRLITDAEQIDLTAEAFVKRVIDQKTIWTVTAISDTFEVRPLYTYEPLSPIYLNNVKLTKEGTIESLFPLRAGHNTFTLMGYITPEVFGPKIKPEVAIVSAEIHVLRFSPFSDTPMNFWAIEPIALTVTLDLIKGYPNNTFKPEKGITRAELVTLLVRSLPINLDELPAQSQFKDVPENHWASKFIAYGAAQGLVSGYPDGSFKPNKMLNRAEGITIMARYAGLTTEANPVAVYPDLTENFWANKYIESAKKAELLKYLEGKDFEPKADFARAEACEVLYQVPAIKQRVDYWWQTGSISGK